MGERVHSIQSSENAELPLVRHHYQTQNSYTGNIDRAGRFMALPYVDVCKSISTIFARGCSIHFAEIIVKLYFEQVKVKPDSIQIHPNDPMHTEKKRS